MGFLTAVTVRLVEWLLEKLGGFIENWVKHEKEVSHIEEQANQDEQALQNAHTPGEKHDAAQTITDHTFNH